MATARGKRTSSKSTGAKKTGAKKNTKSRASARKQDSILSTSMVGIIILSIGTLLLLCQITSSNAAVVVFLRSQFNGVFGYMAVPLILLLCVTGVQIAFGERWPFRDTATLVCLLIMLCLATLLEVFRFEDIKYALRAEQNAVENYRGFLWKAFDISKTIPFGGGFVGMLLGYPLAKYLEVVGSALVLFFVLGGLALVLLKMLFPSIGEQMGEWASQFREDWGVRHQERAAEKAEQRAARQEEQSQAALTANNALLVPVPQELLEQDEPDEALMPPKIAKGRKLPNLSQTGAQPVVRPQPLSAPPLRQAAAPATQTRAQRDAKAQPPAPQRPQSVAPKQAAVKRPRPAQPKLFIEDILPDDYVPPVETSRRKDPDVLPDFLAKRRAQYDEKYGAFQASDTSDEAPEVSQAAYPDGGAYAKTGYGPEDTPESDIVYDDQPGAYDAAQDGFATTVGYTSEPERLDEAGYPDEEGYLDRDAAAPRPAYAEGAARPALPEQPFETAASSQPEPAPWIDDGNEPWEAVEPTYQPEPGARPARRRRMQAKNPLDYQPKLDPETRLDRPDWKPPEEKPVAVPVIEVEAYRQPPFSLLIREERSQRTDTRAQDAAGAQKLEETLQSFGVDARVIKVVHGPAITRYELTPAPGVKVSKIVNLTDDIALNMAAVGVRIEAPIPGKAAIGIEIANDEIETVHLRDVLESDESLKHPSRLAVALGKDIAGKRIIADLARMPHLLIAGATGSGKSVCINTLIASIIYRATPEEARLILIDPKKVELSVYNGIPHLLVPVVIDAKKASGALSWAVLEMDERYRVFADVGVRDIRGYNAQRSPDTPLMPQIVVIIDELSDLMLVAPGEVEESICRLAQLARACGIHLVIATQRPSVNVITGIIKANIPSRIAFAVSSQVDSRTILDSAGAEKLLGKGDMLFAPAGGGKPLRVQGCFVSDAEVARVVDYVKERHTTDYSQAVIDALAATGDENESQPDADLNDSAGDALFQQAVEMAVESGQASISMLQRRLRVGYARAGRLVDEMTRRGIISAAEGAKPREVLITSEDVRLMFKR